MEVAPLRGETDKGFGGGFPSGRVGGVRRQRLGRVEYGTFVLCEEISSACGARLACYPEGRKPMSMTLRQMIDADLFRYTGRLGRGALARAWLKHPGFRFFYHLRHVQHYAPRRRSSGFLPYVLHRAVLNHLRFRFGYDIALNTRIGPGLFLGHFGTVVLSGHSIVGANCNLAQGVTLAGGIRPDRKGTPTLGDRVWVGPNAILLGKITIGSDSLIAPGAVVDFDVPPNSLVQGNPAQIAGSSGSAGLITNTLEPFSVR